MLYWVIKTIALSLLIIFLSHHIYLYFKDILTKPKVKDYINAPKQQYNEIFSILEQKQVQADQPQQQRQRAPAGQQDIMKQELKNFLNDIQSKTI